MRPVNRLTNIFVLFKHDSTKIGQSHILNMIEHPKVTCNLLRFTQYRIESNYQCPWIIWVLHVDRHDAQSTIYPGCSFNSEEVVSSR